MQEFEFTVEDGASIILQTRAGKRTPWAALRIAMDQVDEGMIEPAAALDRLAGIDLDDVWKSCASTRTRRRACSARGRASIGVAVGRIVFDPGAAAELAEGPLGDPGARRAPPPTTSRASPPRRAF